LYPLYLLFPEKEAKSVVLLSRRLWATQNSAMSTQLLQKKTLDLELGLSTVVPKNTLLFPEKEAKSVSSASQKVMGYPKLGEADPGGLGAPKETLAI
jgi:hypothetical protein